MEKPSRNDPCPCNSGKAYKDCHMRSFFMPKESFEVNVSEGNKAPDHHLASHDGGRSWSPHPGRLTIRAKYKMVVYDEIDNILQPIILAVPTNREILRLRLARLRHKLYGVMYHLDNFKQEEDKEIAVLTTKHVGTDHDAIMDDPKILYEIEAFLFQVKSTLDVLAQIIKMVYHLGTIITYADDGDVLIKRLKNNSAKNTANESGAISTCARKASKVDKGHH